MFSGYSLKIDDIDYWYSKKKKNKLSFKWFMLFYIYNYIFKIFTKLFKIFKIK